MDGRFVSFESRDWIGAQIMNAVVRGTTRFLKDDRGASMLEYSILLGIMLILCLLIVNAVGDWAEKQWTALNNEVNSS